VSARRRVLLTGAGGFIGRALARDLAAAGWTVRAALRRPATLPGVAETVTADLAAPVDWRPALDGVDAVVHAAGIAHAGPGLPDALYDRVNRAATLELAEAAAGRVGRFVFLSSIRAQCGPTAPATVSEADPPTPTDAYGRSKLAAEEGLACLDLAVTALRPVVVYGPGVRGNIGALLALARRPVPVPLGSLAAPRSFLALENLCAAVAFALDAPEPPRGPLVVADPVPTTVSGLVAAMRLALGRSPGLVPVPPALLGAAAALVGRRDLWDRLAGPMAADPGRLLRLGWQPPAPSTPEGVARWLGAPPPRG
jgi:nucleoside-diphosphate-sugar epimerase